MGSNKLQTKPQGLRFWSHMFFFNIIFSWSCAELMMGNQLDKTMARVNLTFESDLRGWSSDVVWFQ